MREASIPVRHWILALLFLSTLINYVDRQVLSTLSEELSEKFSWSAIDYSHIVLAFQVAYAIAMSGSGWLIDRLGTRRGFALTASLWSLAGMLTAFARGAWSFGACRFLLGLGEAGNWPGSTKAVSEWFAPRDRAFATGVWNMGSATGAVIAVPLVTWTYTHFGWQAAFVSTGALGFVWLALWLSIYRPPHEHPRVGAAERAYLLEANLGAAPSAPAADDGPSDWLGLLRRPAVWGLVLGRFLSDPVWWFYLFWLVKYLQKQRGFALIDVGFYAWIPWLTADLGSLLGGTASSLLVRRGWPVLRARKTVMVAAALLMPAALGAVRVTSDGLALALISTATFGHQVWSSSMLTLPADLFRGRVVASCSGLSGTGAVIGGMLATWRIGIAADAGHYAAIFTWAGLMHPLAAILVLALVREARSTGLPSGRRSQSS